MTQQMTPPDGIAVRAGRVDAGLDALGGGRVRAAGRRGFDLLQRRRLGRRRHADVGDAFDPRGDGRATGVLQDGLGEGAGGDARGGLAGGGTAAAFDGADAVFRVVSEIRMRRTVGALHLRVGGGALVDVADDDGDRRAEREPVGRKAGEDFRRVAFLALRRQLALAGPAAGQLAAEEGEVERDARAGSRR